MSLGASAALREGRLALKSGNLEAAAERFGAAVSQTPKAALPWVLQAEAYHRLRRYRDAVAAATRAVQLDDGATPAWVRLGAIHLKLGDTQEAARTFERALDVDPTRASEWHRRVVGGNHPDAVAGHPNARSRTVPPEQVFAAVGRDIALDMETGEGRIQERRAREEDATPIWDVGDLIRGRHEVLAIRQGGMAFVHICFDHVQGRPYAVKSLKQTVLDAPGVRESFLREAELWVNLERHPHIVEADLVQVIDDHPAIFLEYMESGSVAGILAECPIELSRAVDIGLQVCDAMQYAHDHAKIIHRDLKPSNVLLTKDGIAKVTDFGLALASDASDEEGGKRTRIYGTPQYMPPEQFSVEREVDRRADVYAFGCTFFEMLTRRWPYKASTPFGFREKHEKDLLPDPRQYNTAVRPELVEIVHRCMQKDPADRYKGFVEVAAALDRVYRMLTGKERPLQAPPDQMNAVHWIAKGTSLAHLGKYQEAVEAFDKSIQIDQELPQGWLGKAEALRVLGQFREALKCCIRALARDPRSVMALLVRGLCNAALDEHEQACKDFDKALEIEPNDAGVWHNKGLSLEALEDHDAAVSAFDRALAVEEAAVAPALAKARCLDARGDSAEAVAVVDPILEADPDNAAAWKVMGAALASLNKWARALTCYQKALEVDPEDERARQTAAELAGKKAKVEKRTEAEASPFERGLWRYKKGRFAEAAAEFEKATEAEPTDERAWRHLSAAYFRVGRYADAEGPSRACVELSPDNAAVRCNLGVILRKLERWAEAREELMMALRLDPNYIKARVELDKVNSREPKSRTS